MARNIAVGVGLMEFPFSSVEGFWRWVDLCEAGGVDSIWQTDRIVSRQPILECMTALAAIARCPRFGSAWRIVSSVANRRRHVSRRASSEARKSAK